MIITILLRAAIFAAELLLRTLPFIILGVIIGELMVTLKIVDKIAIFAKPLIRFAHLRKECGVSFLMSFASLTASNAMLADYHANKLITKKEMFLASLINSSIAASVTDFFLYNLPVTIPLLGLAGIGYSIIFLLIGFVEAGLLMVASRLMFEKRHDTFEPSTDIERKERIPLANAFTQSVKASIPTIKRITLIIVPVLFVVCILIEVGVFDALASYLSNVSSHFPIPLAGLGIIAAQFGNFIAACAVASPLLSAGEITGKEVILILLTGNVLTSIVMAFRCVMPYHVGIFGFRLGLELTVLSTIIWTSITITFLVILIILFGF